MYRHLLVPLDGSELSVETVGRAVEFARDAGARITFFNAPKDYGVTGDGALFRTISPSHFAMEAAGQTRALLAKAEAAARACGVECRSLSKVSDKPYEAILHAAEVEGCDLIFMASRGARSIAGLMLGSETLKVLTNSVIPVLVWSVARNIASQSQSKAIAIIQDEHRSLAVVSEGLQYLVKELGKREAKEEDFRLLKGMLHYVEAFSNALHHPKEDAYLFRKLRARTELVNEAIGELERQHANGGQFLTDLKACLAQFEGGYVGGLETFSNAIEQFGHAQWEHMNLEETTIIPAARKYLNDDDWDEISEAFGKNGDPRFGSEPDEQFRDLFSRIVNLTPVSKD
ncbi:universal stress protein [Ferribacterium limneticum]|uniref:universal stress protein n=1 Tax=Ferribacterium limneticum TaxID=76259 RepID=UPI001CFBE693|nr:universal stress protein [Ferribacterium limneticum]UCV17844.1 universal stress protein [Ferribacterium limneticum]